MTTSNLLSTPPFRISPKLACRFRLADTCIPPVVARLIGDEGRLEMKGFETSALNLDGELVNKELRPAFIEGVRGVLVSERERILDGVLGLKPDMPARGR